jgi:hypothetical protein
MNHDEILKVRAERIKTFRQATGGGTSGVVPAGMASFLLAVSPSRIKALVMSGRFGTISQAGQRWILFASVCKYAEENSSQSKVSSSVVSTSDMSKPGVTKTKMSTPAVSKTAVSKKGVSQSAASKVGTI